MKVLFRRCNLHGCLTQGIRITCPLIASSVFSFLIMHPQVTISQNSNKYSHKYVTALKPNIIQRRSLSITLMAIVHVPLTVPSSNEAAPAYFAFVQRPVAIFMHSMGFTLMYQEGSGGREHSAFARGDFALRRMIQMRLHKFAAHLSQWPLLLDDRCNATYS